MKVSKCGYSSYNIKEIKIYWNVILDSDLRYKWNVSVPHQTHQLTGSTSNDIFKNSANMTVFSSVFSVVFI
jgi:hypothetical protein